jgi:hypothetical protein
LKPAAAFEVLKMGGWKIQKEAKKLRERNLELEKDEKRIQPKVFTYPPCI